MAKITELTVLNPADKTRMFSVATGKGAVSDATDVIVTNVKDFPVGSQYTDITGGSFYVRVAKEGQVSDWKKINT